MASVANGDVRRRKSPSSEAGPPPTPAEFKGSPGSVLSAYLAIFLWLGFAHSIVVMILASFIFLPFPQSLGFVIDPSECVYVRARVWFSGFFLDFVFLHFRVFGLLLMFIVIPVDERSKVGRKIARLASPVCRRFIYLHTLNLLNLSYSWNSVSGVKNYW